MSAQTPNPIRLLARNQRDALADRLPVADAVRTLARRALEGTSNYLLALNLLADPDLSAAERQEVARLGRHGTNEVVETLRKLAGEAS